jgi:hypothetical protein
MEDHIIEIERDVGELIQNYICELASKFLKLYYQRHEFHQFPNIEMDFKHANFWLLRHYFFYILFLLA